MDREGIHWENRRIESTEVLVNGTAEGPAVLPVLVRQYFGPDSA